MTRMRRIFAVALCGVLLGSLTACKVSEDAIAASQQMSATAGALRAYYGALSDGVTDTVALYELDAAIVGIPYDEKDRKVQEETSAELRKREEVSKTLAKVASSLTTLSNSDAGPSAENAATELGNELIALKALPSGSPIPEAIGMAGSFLLKIVQQREEKKAAKAMDETLKAVGDLFEKEKPVYDSLARTHDREAGQIAQDLITANAIDPSPMLGSALRPFALAPLPPSAALQQSLKTLAVSRLKTATEVATQRDQAASKAMFDCLREMSSRVHQLATGKPMPMRATPYELKIVTDWAQSYPAPLM